MNFDGIKGHKKQIEYLDFLLKKNIIYPVLLFTGQSGTGKKIIARRFANALFCRGENPPCFNCSICRQIEKRSFPDFIEIFPNERNIIPIGSEDKRDEGSIRWLIDKLSRKSITGKTVVIIDGIDKIHEEGQNALLKTIEEPSNDVHFILISSNTSAILPTIMSRCTYIRFNPLSEDDIKSILNNYVKSEYDLNFISGVSGGSVEIGLFLIDNENIDNIMNICSEISLYINKGDILNLNISEIQKKTGSRILLDLLINIYRKNLISLINDDKKYFSNIKMSSFPDDIVIYKIDKIIELLKMLISLKRMESQNINLKHALKGLLYSREAVLCDMIEN